MKLSLMIYRLLKSIDKVCISHPINSVNAPINGTLGNRSIEEIVEGLGDLLNKDSVILDLGSGNGKTALKFAVSVGSTAVGIEYDKLRFQGSMVNLVAAMKKFEVKAFFINGDIDTYFETFNGYDIIYMFDTAFTTNTINKIKDAFNRSTTVKAIVCNNILDSIGYDVSLFKCLGSLSAENINRNFYIFKANAFSCSNVAIDEINQIDINKAKYLEQRSNEALLVKTNFLNQTRNMLSVDHSDSKELYDMLQQSPVSINGIMFSRSNEAAGETGRKSCYVLFNRQDLSLLNRFEYKAIQLTSKYLGFITPAYGNNGEILISIIYYACGPVYEAVIYNIRSKSLRKITAKELFGSNLHFNYKNALPDDVDMISVMSIYREKYPIKELIKKVIHVEADEDLEPEDLKLILPTKRKASSLVISNKVLKVQTVDLTESSKQSKFKKVKEDSLAKLQEENRMLKRRHEELEKELNKKSKLDNNKATTDLIRETKESERLMKAKDNEIIKLKKEQEREINQIKTNQDRQINEMKTNEDRKINEIKTNQDRQISEMKTNEDRKINEIKSNQDRQINEIKSYEEKERKLLERQLHDNMIEREIMKSKCAEESTRSELMKLAAVNEQIIIELKKEREVRDADRKEYNQVTTKLYDRIIETHENNNNNNRADTKGYFDKILDLANNVISKLTKEV